MVVSVSQIHGLYATYFGRPADLGGLKYWSAAGGNGMSIEDMAKSFASSEEAKTQYPFLSSPEANDPGEFVDLIYMNAFGRTAEPGGKEFWTNYLKTLGAEGTSTFILTINQNAVGDDIAAFKNRISISEIFIQEMSKVEDPEKFGSEIYTKASEILAKVDSTEQSLTDAIKEIMGIISPNSVPVAAPDTYSTNENAPINLNVLANDGGLEGNPPTVTAVGEQAVAAGDTITLASGALLTLKEDGTFDYDPNGKFDPLKEGELGNDSFEYTIDDGEGGTSTASVKIEITGVNTPFVAVDDTFSAVKDAPTTLNVLANDSDPDGDAESKPPTVTAVGGQAVEVGVPFFLRSGALLTLMEDGTFDYNPNGQFADLKEGELANDSFEYTIDDGEGGTSTASVTIEIAGTNTPSVAVEDTFSAVKDAPINLDVLANDSDPDGDPLTVTAVGEQAVAAGDTITLASGALLTLKEDGTFDYDPNGQFDALKEGELANDSFEYTIDDGKGGTSTASVTIEIPGVNTPPVAEGDAFSTEKDALINLNVLANDSDLESDSLTVTAVGEQAVAVGDTITLASGALLTLKEDGTFDYDPNGRFAGLKENINATDKFEYTISDGNEGGTSTASVTIEIKGSKDNPVAADDAFATDENAPINLDVLANDSDPEGVPLTVTAVGQQAVAVGDTITLASGASLTLKEDGTFDYDPTNSSLKSLDTGEIGSDSFEYTVDDGQGNTDTAAVKIDITGFDNEIISPIGKDELTGTDGGKDIFMYQEIRRSFVDTFDVISKFDLVEDKIKLPKSFTGKGLDDLSAATTNANDVEDVLTDITTKNLLAVDDFGSFQFGGNTYVLGNDGTAAIAENSDMLIEIQGEHTLADANFEFFT